MVEEGFGFENGLFAGFDQAQGAYDRTAWEYERGPDGFVRRDMTLQHPRCVFQLLKEHYSRYTPEVVAQIAGCSAEQFLSMRRSYAPLGPRTGSAPSCTPWAGRCTPWEARSSARRRSSSSSSAISAGREGASTRSGSRQRAGRDGSRHRRRHSPWLLEGSEPAQTSLASHLEESTPRPLVADTVNYWGNYPKFMISQLRRGSATRSGRTTISDITTWANRLTTQRGSPCGTRRIRGGSRG